MSRGSRLDADDLMLEAETDLALPGLVCSRINLDGGNVVFSPSRTTAVVSDRVFAENPKIDRGRLLDTLEKALEARVIVIPSLPRELDMTGHADGMFRFVKDDLALVNRFPGDPLEAEIRRIAEESGIGVIEMPYVDAREIDPGASEISAAGCYINFLETEKYVFVPAFGIAEDAEAAETVGDAFGKKAVQVRCDDLAEVSGLLNCVTWEE